MTSEGHRLFSILTIDDSEDTLILQELALTRAGHNVFTSTGGEDALKKIGSLPRLDLILLDVQMKDLSGPDLLKRVREDFPEVYETVPFIFVTANSQPPEVKVAGWIRKMTDLDEFVASVESFLNPRAPKIEHESFKQRDL